MNLARHTLYNLIGLGAPLLVALGCIPILLGYLGPERFGLLSLIWALTAYFGLLDLGLGRALTYAIARRAASERQRELQPLVCNAMLLLAGVGLTGMAVILMAAAPLASLLRGVRDLDGAIAALRCMALAVPLIVLTSGLRGVLEAHQAFSWVNLIRLPLGLWTFLGPWLACAVWGPDLLAITAMLLGGRILALMLHGLAVRHVLAESFNWSGVSRERMIELLQGGGWITVGNLISPLMGMVDRFVVGVWVSAGAVSWYSTAQELVGRLWVVPGALTAALFPAFSAASDQREAQRLALFAGALHALAGVMLPLTAVMALFADELLAVWLGAGFAQQAAPLLRLFALAAFINCLAHIPFTLLQGVGAARATALLYCVELPIFMLGLWLVVPKFGVLGAAWLWLVRITIDTLALFCLVQLQQKWRTTRWLNRGHAMQLLGASMAFGGLACTGLVGRLTCLAVGSSVALLPCLTLQRPLKSLAQ